MLILSLNFIFNYFPKIPGRVAGQRFYFQVLEGVPNKGEKIPLKGKLRNSDAFSSGIDPDHGRGHFPAIPCRRRNHGYRFSVEK